MKAALWYARVPDVVDRALFRLLWRIRAQRLRTLTRERWTDPDGEMSVVNYGRTATVEYFLDGLLGRDRRRVESLDVPLRDVKGAPDADLTIVRGPRSRLEDHLKRGWHRVPEVVHLAVEIPPSASGSSPWHNRSTDNNIRRVKHNGLTAVHTRDVADFDRFFDDFYVPYLRARFGDQANFRSRHRVRRWFRSGGLVWVRQEDRLLAGDLYSIEGRTAHSRLIAANPEHPDALELGAMAAAYLHLFEWAQANELDWVELGPSRPSLNDGVLFHKRRWGGILRQWTDGVDELFFHWPAGLTKGAAKLLYEHPLVERLDGRLCGLSAVPSGSDPEKTHAHLSRIAVQGLARLRVYSDPQSRSHAPEVGGVPVEWMPLARVAGE